MIAVSSADRVPTFVRPMSFNTKPAKEIGAACTTSIVVPLALNWTDVIKTRMQSVPVSGCTAPPYVGGFSSIGQRIMAEEGLLTLWGTGILASSGREMIVLGVRIGAYPAVRDALSHLGSGSAGGDAAIGTKLGAGVVLGAISGVMATPFDLVRIQLQAGAGKVDSNGMLTTGLRAGQLPQFRSTPHAFLEIFREGTFGSGLFRGSGVNVGRSICMTVGTMPVYEHTKHVAKSSLGIADGPALHLGAGVVAGLVGVTLTMPADVMRTRVMQTGKGGTSLITAFGLVAREHGLRGFFRGWLPAYMRVGPLFLIFPALVEQVRKHLFGLDYMV